MNKMMRPGRPLGVVVGLVLLAALGGALASPPAARSQAADVLLNVLATGAKKLNIVIPHFTVVGGPDTQGLGKSLSLVTARDLTFSSLFSVVSDVPPIPAGIRPRSGPPSPTSRRRAPTRAFTACSPCAVTAPRSRCGCTT